jgi:hypothetical protein
MIHPRARTRFLLASSGALMLSLPANTAQAQIASASPAVKDTVVQAGARYAAGSLRRKLLGDNYRDAWTTPVRVPVLDLQSFAGGVKPYKEGGGRQGRSLRFVTKDSVEYVFRPVMKTMLSLPDEYRGTIIWSIFRDQGSGSFPAAPIGSDALLHRAEVIHPEPKLYVMPDDPALGDFRKHFAGVFGMMEEYPSTPPNDAPGFPPGADKIEDSDSLLVKLNTDPKNQVDARALLTARLMDLLLGDNDRHPGQWKWARFKKDDSAPWVPIPRDRDKVFVSYGGLLLGLARRFEPSLVKFEGTYPRDTVLFANAVQFDRRLLAGLDKSVWDSTAAHLVRAMTDGVIDEAVRQLPREYASSSNQVAAILKVRRDHLSEAATRYYLAIWDIADIHGTDADERATATRNADGSVEISIRTGNSAPWFRRRFDAADTREIRLYLHGGNDVAVVRGDAPRSIKLRVIGGNGTNTLLDSSTVRGRTHPTLLYDPGSVQDVKYARDTVDENISEDDALNHYFNRRPWVRAYGTLIPPLPDRGSTIRPVVGFHNSRGLGTVVRVGAARYVYAFRHVPYSSMMKADVAYATTNRYEVALGSDNRLESSDFHIPAEAKMSQFEVVQFHGFGNDVQDLRGRFYDVRQRQWSFRPAAGFSFGPESDVSLGPVVRYTVTDSVENRFIAAQRPYGFSHFGQAGLQLRLHYDSRVHPDTTRPRAVVDVAGSSYPAMWDVEKAYSAVSGVASTYITLRVPQRPVLAFRAGGKKLFGDFPYFDAAFLGGSGSIRTEDRQRFAGDASLFGSAELRVPVAQFPLILPLDVGLLGFVDAGRVYVDGDSPGGWHAATGAGFWVGFVNPGTNINVLITNDDDRRVLTSLGFAF